MLVDTTFLEYCHELGRRYERDAPVGSFEIIGLEAHTAISEHPDALHASRKYQRRMTARQKRIADMAESRGWVFDIRRDWDPAHLDDFHFFRLHPIEYRDTVVHGSYDGVDEEIEFTIADVTFDEGALIPEVYHTTAQVIRLPIELPELVLEKEELLDRALELAGVDDIDYEHLDGFSRKFVIKAPDEPAVRAFMTPELIRFFEREEIYHLESTGDEIVVFKTLMRRSTAQEIEDMLSFSERLVSLLVGNPPDTTLTGAPR
jgi:hypothetical protein